MLKDSEYIAQQRLELELKEKERGRIACINGGKHSDSEGLYFTLGYAEKYAELETIGGQCEYS